jgi:hypothetical protein
MLVEWEIADTTEDIAEYGFDVYRSEAEHGPYQRMTPRSLVDRYSFADLTAPTQNYIRELWYVVRVTHIASGEYFEHRQTSKRGQPSAFAMQIQRNSLQQFRVFNGRWLYLYPTRTFGYKCPSCTDDLTGITSVADCRTCYGTTYTGGFHYPVKFLGQIDGTELAEQLSDQNQGQVLTFQLRTPTASPMLKPGDLIVDDHNERYRITKTSTTSMRGIPLHYEAAMVWCPHSDILYTVPLTRLDDEDAPDQRQLGWRGDVHSADSNDRIDGGSLPELLLDFPS